MTVFSLLKPGGRFLQWLVFVVGGLGRPADVDRLAMIHFARLAVIRRLPDYGQGRDELRQPLQLFESNYNGSFNQYIDTFVDAIPGRMRAFWGTSYGFPCRLPIGPFKCYIDANQFRIAHYYVHNPDASARIVGSAVRIAQANAELRRDAPHLDPDAFADRFRTLLGHLQTDL